MEKETQHKHHGRVVTGDYFHGTDVSRPARLRFLHILGGRLVGVEVPTSDEGAWATGTADVLVIGGVAYRSPPDGRLSVPAKLIRLLADGAAHDLLLQQPDIADRGRLAGTAFRPWIVPDDAPDPVLLARLKQVQDPVPDPLPQFATGYIAADTYETRTDRYDVHVEWEPATVETSLFFMEGPRSVSLDDARTWCAAYCRKIVVLAVDSKSGRIVRTSQSLT